MSLKHFTCCGVQYKVIQHIIIINFQKQELINIGIFIEKCLARSCPMANRMVRFKY